MQCYESNSKWFLVQCKPNSHAIAMRNLARQGFKTFMPQHEQTIRTRERFIVRTRPLFPGYLFVSLDLLLGRWRAVTATYGISRIVSMGREPTPIPTDLVNELMSRCDAEGTLLPPRLFEPGDEVTLTQGLFVNIIATIASTAPDQRIWVLMDIMGGQKQVAVRPEHLRAV